jgi:hypothetical protein
MEPVDLKIGNIDPGHVTDANDRRYLYFSSGGYVPLSDDGLSVAGRIPVFTAGQYLANGPLNVFAWKARRFCGAVLLSDNR